MQSKLRDTADAHRRTLTLRLEAYAGHFLLNRGDNPVHPSSQQYCYRFLDCAEPSLNESKVCEYHGACNFVGVFSSAKLSLLMI